MAASIHKFYECKECRIVYIKEGKVNVRLLLLMEAIRKIMKTIFGIVGIRRIDKM